jgi:outer membrane protein OmpA-like peptidoglycan-associated protein
MRRAVVLFAALGLAISAIAPLQAQNATGSSSGRAYVVFFQEWSAALDTPALQTIAAAAAIAAKDPNAPVIVTGYADPLGSVQANIYLTETRAQVVTDQLTADGVNPVRIRQRAAGKVGFQLTSQESRRVVIAIGGS